MENGPFEDVFPVKHGDIPLLYMLVYQRVLLNDHDGCGSGDSAATGSFSQNASIDDHGTTNSTNLPRRDQRVDVTM